MKIAYSSLAMVSIIASACGSNEPSGAAPQTSRFDDGTFALIKCKDPTGKDGLALDMVVAGDKITAIKVKQGKQLIKTYGFVEAVGKETDEGLVIEVKLAEPEGSQKASARWNLEQRILVVGGLGLELLNGTSCTISNKLVWESLAL